MHPLFRISALLLALALCGCSLIEDILPGESKKPLPGKRVSVLNLDRQLEPDPTISQIVVRLPPPVANKDWPEAGGNSTHAMQHLALGDQIRRAWSRSIGDGDSRHGQILSAPVIDADRVFTMDANSVITAFDAKDGHRLWEFDPQPKDAQSTTFGGGLAVVGDRVYVSTGYAQILALEAATGKEIWRHPTAAPIHSPPTVAEGRVFAVTVENQLIVVSTEDGHVLWQHTGLPTTAGLLGGSSPAVEGDIVVVAYSSGEVFALRAENGRALWSDNLASARSLDALSALADIRGRPIIDRGRVYAISHSGRMVAIDLRSGDRVWEQDIGGSYSPWVAGEFIYVLSNDSVLVCLTRREGRIKWALELPRYQDEKKKSDPLEWAGPVLASDRLIVTASDGEAISVSPYTGKPLGRIDLPAGSYISPVLADKTLYILTQEADLVAYR